MRKTEAICAEDVVIAWALLAADTACARWAAVEPTLDGPALTPHASGPRLLVTWPVIRQGIWRLVLVRHDALPSGASRVTQHGLLAALADGNTGQLWPIDADQVVQVGLFGEVRF